MCDYKIMCIDVGMLKGCFNRLFEVLEILYDGVLLIFIILRIIRIIRGIIYLEFYDDTEENKNLGFQIRQLFSSDEIYVSKRVRELFSLDEIYFLKKVRLFTDSG